MRSSFSGTLGHHLALPADDLGVSECPVGRRDLVEKRVLIATTHQWATVFHLTLLIADHVQLPHGVRALYSTARPTGQPLLLPASGPAPCPVHRKERSLYLERFPP